MNSEDVTELDDREEGIVGGVVGEEEVVALKTMDITKVLANNDA